MNQKKNPLIGIKVLFLFGLFLGLLLTPFGTINAATSCTLNGASWFLNGSQLDESHEAKVGNNVTLKVTGQGCDGFSVSFDIYEWDPTVNDYLRTVQGKFANNTAQTNTTLTADDYVKGGNEYLGENLLFNAKVFDGTGKQIGSISSHPSASNQTDLVEFSQVWYACVAADGNYACSPGNKADLSDVAKNACLGRKAVQIDSNSCGNPGSESETGSNGGSSGSGSGSTGSTGPTHTPVPTQLSFEITNPLVGGPNTIFDVIDIVTKWLVTFSIPIAVLAILYAGFLFLTAGAKPGNVKSARYILTWTVVGLAVIFIGRGFITLIFSVLDLQNTNAPSVQQNAPPQSTAPYCDLSTDTCSNGAGPCSTDSQCFNNTTQNNSDGTLRSASTLDTNDQTENLPSGENGSVQYQQVLEISQDSPAPATAGQFYQSSITIHNPAGPAEVFNWTKTSGDLPPGMSISAQSGATNQRIAGTPTKKGSYSLTLQAMDIPAREYGTVKVIINVQ